MSLSKHFSNRTKRMKPVAIREIVKATRAPGFISFTAGKPAPSMFPLGAIAETSGIVIEKHGSLSLQYSATEGYQPLREWIASRFPHVTADDVQIVSGSQQAIDLMGKVFLNPGDKVAVSSPTYMGALSCLNVYETEFVTIASDEHGMLPDALEAALQQKPKFLYCIPNFMNPTGVDMSLERRQQTVELARKYDVPILEDDPYGTMRFEGEPLPSLFELAPELVIYAGTFSKILAPGLRLAWLMTPTDALTPLTLAKQAGDLQTPIYVQMIAHELTRDGFIDAQITRTQQFYGKQRDLMMAAIERHFPPEAKVNSPRGGMFAWVELPDGLDAKQLLFDKVMPEKVAYIPGEQFYAKDGQANTLRLSFSMATADEIEQGIAVLGRVFKEAIAERNLPNTP